MTKLEAMRRGGKITASILQQVLSTAKPGIKTKQLDELAERLILKAGGKPSFKLVQGYHWATCINVNDGVVHGTPSGYKLNLRDVLSIDLGVFYLGFHTDASWTIVVGKEPVEPEINRFLLVGERALDEAIKQAKLGNRVGHISAAIEKTVESAGYLVVRGLVGHGVGRELHQKPQIPGFLDRPLASTPKLQLGMTLAIEVIYTKGSSQVEVDRKDGWTARTVDHSLAGLFEHTIAILKTGPEILTKISST
jgi:methionyl aminopeptidase